MVFHAPVRPIWPASAPGCLNERAGVAGGARLRACRVFCATAAWSGATHPVRRAARGAASAGRFPQPRRQGPLAAVILRAPARRSCAHRGTAVARSSRDPAGGEAAPVNYQAVALTVGSAFAFGAGVYVFKGGDSASEFFAGYLLEQSLSVDNLFVFVLLFGYFKVPKAYEAKVLEFGILGAAGLRAVFILLGAVVLERFRPVLLAFAALLLFSSAKMLFGGDEEEDSMDDNAVVSLVRRLLPVSPAYDGDAFFTQVEGVRTATPLLLVLVVIELSDLVFAVDSIPAVFGVTTDPFIVYTSNMFAIAALRSLFPLVAGAMGELKYLDKAVSLVLGFIGAKMVADVAFDVHVSTSVSLAVVVGALSAGVGLSLALPDADKPEAR